MTNRFVSLDTYDVRFPTSRQLDGSDAMNPDPDYSAAYVVLRTDAGDGLEGHGFAFTIGRGNDVQAAAIQALRAVRRRPSVDATLDDLGGLYARARARLAAALARPGEGRHAHGDRRASSTRCGTWRPSAPGMPLWQLLSRHDAGGDRRPRRLPLPHRRADPASEALEILRARGAGPGRAGRAAAAPPATRRTPPRPAGSATTTTKLRPAVPGGGRRGLHPDQAQGRRRPRRRRPPHAARPRGGRPGHPDRGRRQPALGRRRRDRLDRRALAPFDP